MRSGSVALQRTAAEQCQWFVKHGAGEIILQSVDRDGLRQGMDLENIVGLARDLPLPLIALGGAGNLEHLSKAIEAGASAAAS